MSTAQRIVLSLLLTLCIVRLWLMPLTGSFWADETATAFVVHYGAGHPSLAIAPQVAESIYYWLPWAAEKLGGFSEVVYRLPSLLALAGALFLIARLAARLIHPDAAWFAMFVCLSMRGFNFQGNDARPYALGTLVAVAGVWFLVRWLDSARWWDALIFAVCGALLWRVQFVYWPFYPVLALYAGYRIARRETTAGRGAAAAVFGVTCVALIPVALRALALFAGGRAHVIAPMPTAIDLLHAVDPVLIVVAGALLTALGMRWRSVAWPVSWPSLVLTIAWWLIPPVALFAFSWFSRESLFVPRYYSLRLPGIALAGTALAARFIPASRWLVVSAVLGLGILAWVGDWRLAVPDYHNSDWRGAAQAVNARVLTPETPVICTSPFVEGRWPVWHPDYPLPSFLYAPLAVYPIHGRVLTFPQESSPRVREYAASLLQNPLRASRRFFLYGTDASVEYWQRWFRASLDARAWTSRRIGPSGVVELVEFDQTDAPGL